MSQKTGGTCTETQSYSWKDIICIKCLQTWGGVHFVQSSLQIYYFKYTNIAKMEGGGYFIQNSQFIIYKNIILGIKLIAPNLFSRIEFCFICYPMYTQFEAHFRQILILEDRFQLCGIKLIGRSNLFSRIGFASQYIVFLKHIFD